MATENRDRGYELGGLGEAARTFRAAAFRLCKFVAAIVSDLGDDNVALIGESRKSEWPKGFSGAVLVAAFGGTKMQNAAVDHAFQRAVNRDVTAVYRILLQL